MRASAQLPGFGVTALQATSKQGESGGVVRQASAQDLPCIKVWLAQEARDGSGFIHDWASIEKACAAGNMLVWESAGVPVAFITSGISTDTILQVRAGHQCLGIGRALVEHAIALEEAAGEAVMVVQCEPKSSVGFWTRMGFEPHRSGHGEEWGAPIFMQRLSTRSKRVPGAKADQLVVVRVYPESALYTPRDLAPDRVHYVMAWFDPSDRVLNLSRRVSISNEQGLGDPVVEVTCGGLNLLKKTKAKRLSAREAGFVRTPSGWGWYLDELHLPGDMSSC